MPLENIHFYISFYYLQFFKTYVKATTERNKFVHMCYGEQALWCYCNAASNFWYPFM